LHENFERLPHPLVKEEDEEHSEFSTEIKRKGKEVGEQE
jgi:hypothetical protein